MAVDQSTLQMLQTEPAPEHDLDLSWMDQTGERGMSAKPGRRGLTIEEINKGSYGESPEWSKSSTAAGRSRVIGSMCSSPRTSKPASSA